VLDFVVPYSGPETAGAWQLETFEVDERGAKFSALRGEYVPPGKYTRITRGGQIIMSDTPMEKRTHWPILRAAKGRVLINGLGLGMIAQSVALKPDVEQVDVVEIDERVIGLIAPHLHVKVRVHHADAFAFKPERDARFGAVWHDIWDDICADNLEQMATLHRKYARKADWQGSWAKAECQYARRRYA
jgi:hypothetical protein